jgi:O-antigen/teichoic acid export membrane protein
MTAQGPRRGAGAQAGALALATGLSQILVAVVYLLAARDADPAAFGLVVAAIGLGTAAVGFVDFGTNSFWVREGARATLGADVLRQRMATKTAISFAVAFVWTAVTASFFAESQVWIAGPVLLGMLMSQTLQVPLRSASRIEVVAACILADRAVAIVSFLLLTLAGLEAIDVLWVSLVLGSLCSSGLLLALTPRQQRISLSDLRLSNPWRGSRYFGLSTLANSAQSLDVTLLTAVSGSVSAGIFGAVSRWTQPMGLLAAAFSSVIAPVAARARSLDAAWPEIRRAVWMPAGAVAAAAVVFVAAPTVVELLLGPAYADSAIVLRYLALASIASIIGQPIMVVLQALGRDRFAAAAMAMTVVIQLVLILLLAPSSGALGAAVASAAAQALLVVVLLIGLWSEIRRTRRSTDPEQRDEGDDE